jgi:Leucine-rich repeat (LRR) protein
MAPAPLRDFDCIDYVSPPKADGWVTSLGGVECIPNLRSLRLEPYRLDLALLAQLPHLAEIWFGVALESTLPSLPQVTTLTAYGLLGNENAIFHAFRSLKTLHLSGAGVRDISALVGLVALSGIDLSRNQITDLSPLVANPGIGSGATVDITNNPFLCAAQMQNIAALRQRGVVVTTDCP